VRVVIGVMAGRAFVAQGVVGFPVFRRYSVDDTLIKKTLQNTVHGYAVYLSLQPLHNIGMAKRTGFMAEYIHYQLLSFRISSLLLHQNISLTPQSYNNNSILQ
jgi:uncharacterized protein YybS (DUF2232 family)